MTFHLATLFAAISLLSCTTLADFSAVQSVQETTPFMTTEEYSFSGPRPLSDEEASSAFSAFVSEFGKIYKTEKERASRFMIFRENADYIRKTNSEGLNFKLAINKFADMAPEEVIGGKSGSCLNSPMEDLPVDHSLSGKSMADYPTNLDWREKGCVQVVKNQGQCGSCWAFSVTGAVEGAVCKSTGKLPNLSEQQLVDCAGKEGNAGCSGGFMDKGMQYILDADGICTEAEYPYLARRSWLKGCQASRCTTKTKIDGYYRLPEGDEAAMVAAVNEHGPLSIGIYAEGKNFMYYKSGIIDSACGTQMDHGILIVGYGHDETTNEDYWIVKNSWGTVWGENGFAKVLRNKGNEGECGIALFPTYAKVPTTTEATEIAEL